MFVCFVFSHLLTNGMLMGRLIQSPSSRLTGISLDLVPVQALSSLSSTISRLCPMSLKILKKLNNHRTLNIRVCPVFVEKTSHKPWINFGQRMDIITIMQICTYQKINLLLKSVHPEHLQCKSLFPHHPTGEQHGPTIFALAYGLHWPGLPS